MAGNEEFESPSATPRVHVCKHSLQRNIALKLPPAVFAPITEPWSGALIHKSTQPNEKDVQPHASFIWLPFTPKFEPTSSKMAKAQPCRLRACNARSPHQKNPLPYFLFLPAEIPFAVEKDVSGGALGLSRWSDKATSLIKNIIYGFVSINYLLYSNVFNRVIFYPCAESRRGYRRIKVLLALRRLHSCR